MCTKVVTNMDSIIKMNAGICIECRAAVHISKKIFYLVFYSVVNGISDYDYGP